MNSFNNLSPEQLERLALLAEEAGELVQAVMKIVRHGYASEHPDSGIRNIEQLEDEIGDVLASIEILAHAGDINKHNLEKRMGIKLKTVGQYLHHNKIRIPG